MLKTNMNAKNKQINECQENELKWMLKTYMNTKNKHECYEKSNQ